MVESAHCSQTAGASCLVCLVRHLPYAYGPGVVALSLRNCSLLISLPEPRTDRRPDRQANFDAALTARRNRLGDMRGY